MEVEELYRAAEIEGAISDPDTAHLIIDGGKSKARTTYRGSRSSPNPSRRGWTPP